ncbi:MAG: phenylalanine--tRNA ligase subunit beta [Thermoguttaceae bacterium]|jgi:phenylalanyl-tRNA synthetase beta chain|nr:phenylalanine--tRNA ligase subunit beta [Thermoguttaceae bacterium]
MYISLDWISDFVDISDVDPQVVADKLTMATAEVESISTITRYVDGVVVGEIISAQPFETPDGKTRALCEVNCGAKTYTTVCGAKNARVGLKAPFAPAGTALGAKVIEKSEVYGHASEGILCSAGELGMSSWHEILLECPADTPVGATLSDYIPATDVLVEIDNKSLTHRPDLWGHYGFARELAAIFHRELKPYPLHDVDQYDDLPRFPVAIEDENCVCYSGIVFKIEENLTSVPSPLKMQRRLHALGQKTIDLLVDLTNYVSLELGQPTHAFDADLVSNIRVAPMGKEGVFKTLDGVERKMIPEDMMICDGDKPVAVAGVMGGLETEITGTTTRVVLESANFRSERIRKTAGRLNLRTDASQRYEKSQPPANTKVGAERILKLLEESGTPFKVETSFSLAGDLHDETRYIELAPGRMNTLVGVDFPEDKTLEILRSIQFEAEFLEDGTLRVGVPPFRSKKDISIEEDIVEEVTRIFGFDNIEPVLPTAPVEPLFVEEYIRLEHRMRRMLAAGYGFLEIHNYGWFNDNWIAKLGFDPGATLELLNPVAPYEARMRTTLIPNMLALVGKNRASHDTFRIFELGRVYFLKGAVDDQRKPIDSAEKCREERRLAGVSFVQSGVSLEDHYLEIKAALEDVAKIHTQGSSELKFVATKENKTPWQKVDYSVEIFSDGVNIGALGVLDKQTLAVVSPEGGQVVWFEIELDKFPGSLYPTYSFVEPLKFPGSWQDFSLVWPLASGYEGLAAKLDEFTHPLLLKRSFVTSYKGKGMEKGMGSFSFRYEIGAPDHTLSGEEIEDFHEKFLEFLKANEIALR